MKIAVLGKGTVGGGIVEILDNANNNVSNIEVKRILELQKNPEDERITDCYDDIISDSEIDTVVECIGGVDPAYDYIKRALLSGKNVVTSNKAVVSEHYAEFIQLANDNGVSLHLEACAGGGIPWINAILRSKRIDKITAFSGIINGTSNYIIDRMEKENADFTEVLKDAQKLGYAEKNPSADIDGWDVRAKAMISGSICFNTVCDLESIPTCGIRSLTKADIDTFEEMGLRVRMIARGICNDSSYFICVEPELSEINTLEANTPGYFNTVSLTGETIGELKFFGAGAGALPTANAVVQDLIDINSGIKPNYDTSKNLTPDPKLMLSSYIYRTSADGALPKRALLVRPGYYEITSIYPTEAHEILEKLLPEDPNAFMASVQKAI